MKKLLFVAAIAAIPIGLYTTKTLANSKVADNQNCKYAEQTSIYCARCAYADPHDPCHKNCPNDPHNPTS